MRLFERPCVIRLDVSENAAPGHNFLLPRTPVQNFDSGLSRLLQLSTQLAEQKYEVGSYCFIIHRFIPAHAGAFAFATPGSSRVRIDSTWGIPDGLLFYPHDSYEVECASGSRIVAKRIRCKDRYIEALADGKWKPLELGAPWDWSEPIKANQLFRIAEAATKIAQKAGRPVEIMFFITHSSSPDGCLAWFMTDATPNEAGPDVDELHAFGRYLSIRTPTDLDDVERQLKNGPAVRNLAFRLSPNPEFLRSPAFLDRIAEVCRAHNIPVELEGSELSHPFYILRRQHVKLRCSRRIEPQREKQRFDKLVRDKIPLRIQQGGEVSRTVEVSKAVHLRLLKMKAVEEALELYRAERTGDLAEESADLLEVVTALATRLQEAGFDVHKIAEQKKSARGGFEQGVFLIETEKGPAQISNESLELFPTPKGSDNDDVIRRADQRLLPRLDGASIRVSLIPIRDETIHRLTMPLGETEIDVEVVYKGSHVLVTLRERPPSSDSDQLEFSLL
jgi:predicted house-cleaning noncanonical NTP pyrophosphatase (MazG superfamily)